MNNSAFPIFPQQQLVLSNGCAISYIDEGDQAAPCILFLHGLATSASSWSLNISGLKNHFRCIAVDLPGNGHSGRGDYKYGMQFFAGCIYEFITALGLSELTICGHSMGGQVAMTLLIHAPETAERLILCAAAGLEQFSVFERSMYRSAMGFLDLFSSEEMSLKKTIYSSFYQQPQQADPLIRELIDTLHQYPVSQYRKMMEACVNSMLEEPVYNRLGDIVQPTLVLFGERDALIPNKLIHPMTTRQLAIDAIRQMPAARLEMIPQCGHFLQIEKADTVNRLIREFLDR